MHADAATVEAASPAVGHGSRRALALLCSVSSSGPARRRVAGGNIRARGYAFLCSAAPATAAGGGLVVAVAVAVGGEGFGFSGRVSGAWLWMTGAACTVRVLFDPLCARAGHAPL